MIKTRDNTKSCIYWFPCAYKPLKKFNLHIRPVRLRVTNNFIEKSWQYTMTNVTWMWSAYLRTSPSLLKGVPAPQSVNLLFWDHSWLQFVDTVDSKTLDKGGLLFPDKSARHNHVFCKLIPVLEPTPLTALLGQCHSMDISMACTKYGRPSTSVTCGVVIDTHQLV